MKEEWFNQKITLWQRFKLLFIKPRIIVDFGNSDQTVISYSKIINDKFYFYDKR